jgi:hypothetical protein
MIRVWRVLAFSSVAVAMLAGCGGGSSGGSTATAVSPAKVTGVSTPKSVSVVTAN